ncbi:MAG TPA: acyl carrier protein, partial [Roseiflexaceae bacterium]|nr:acyl carrier protein [Roseiflexaceae bacterium]
SLVASRVLTRIHERLGITIPLQQIFTSATIADLAPLIESAQWAQRGPPSTAEGEREEGEL